MRHIAPKLAAAALLVGAAILVSDFVHPVQAATGDQSESKAFVDDAANYLKKGDINAAVIQLKNALQKDPGNITARRMLGEIYLRVGNGPAAEKELRSAKRRGATDKRLDLQIAEANILQSKFDVVLKELKDNVSDPKIRVEVLYVRGRAHLGLRQLDQAEAAFKEAESVDSADIRPKIGTAQVLVNRGRLKEAENKIDASLQVNPDALQALVLKGELRRLNRDLKGAVAAFDRALKISQFNIPARLGRAAALIDLNRDDAAHADLQAVFQRVQRHPLASYLAALMAAKKKDFNAAQESLQQAGAALDDHMPSVFLRGAINYALNQLEQAAVNLTRYVAEVPDNARARKLLGATLVRKNEPRGAIEALLPLVGTKDEDAQVLALLGSAYMRTAQYAKGSQMFEKASASAPSVSAIRTQLALSHLAQGASEKAVTDLQAAVDLDPDARQATILLSLVHLRKREFAAALETAEKLRRSSPDNPLAHNLVGAALLGLGKADDARKSFEIALAKKPDFHPARMNLAQLDLSENKVDRAKQELERIISQDDKHIGAMMALASIAAQQNDEDKVVDWLKKAAEADPKSLAPRLRLVRYYEERQETAKALSVARDLKVQIQKDPQVLETLGRLELVAREPQAAAATYRELVALAENVPAAHHLLGGALVAAKDRVGARRSFERALSIDENYLPSMMAIAELDSQDGKIDRALEIAAKVVEKRPKLAAGRLLIGDIQMRAKRYDKAYAAYQEGIMLEDSGVLAVRRFNALRAAGKMDQGLQELQAWVDRRKDDNVRNILASAYISAKNFDAAIRESERLLIKAGSNPVVLNNLAWLYDERGDERAVEYAERALKLAPKAPAVMDTLGWILLKKGQSVRALQLLQTAHDAAPRSGDIAYHLAVALNKSGKTDEAKRLLDRILEENGKFSEVESAKKLRAELGN